MSRNPIILLRRGEGPVWGRLKRAARAILHLHLPVVPLTRPLSRMLYSLHVAVRECGIWFLRFFWFEPLFRSQCRAVGRDLYMEFLPYISGRGRIVLGDGVRMAGKPNFAFLNRWTDDPELLIGDHSFIGHGCSISVASSIRIGRYCLLSSGVGIADYDGHPTNAMLRRTSPAPPESIMPVVLGDDVWIGAGSQILKGVSIGDRSIVAARSVVTKSVPPDVIVAGNPARIVKYLAEPPDHREPSCVVQTNGREE